MRRDLAIVTLTVAGLALLCFAALGWLDYQGFVISLRWR
jgi:hypothetical protein